MLPQSHILIVAWVPRSSYLVWVKSHVEDPLGACAASLHGIIQYTHQSIFCLDVCKSTKAPAARSALPKSGQRAAAWHLIIRWPPCICAQPLRQASEPAASGGHSHAHFNCLSQATSSSHDLQPRCHSHCHHLGWHSGPAGTSILP